MNFEIIKNSISAELLVEDSADEGVKKIADAGNLSKPKN